MDWKKEAVKQWDNDPCGADAAKPFASPEFFASVEAERYGRYAPWMPAAIGFERYAGRRLLEVGFGLGTDHLAFARAGASCFGIDLTPAHVFATRRRLELEQRRIRLARADAEDLPFPGGSFDVVYSFGVLHHTPDTERSVAEIHRVLRPGGEAVVGLYHRDSAFFWGYCVAFQGLLRGGFVRNGYRKTVSRVELRRHSDAIPLVRVFSRSSARRLFGHFEDVRIDIRHFEFPRIRDSRWLGPLLRRVEPAFARRFGWYLIVHARKAAV